MQEGKTSAHLTKRRVKRADALSKYQVFPDLPARAGDNHTPSTLYPAQRFSPESSEAEGLLHDNYFLTIWYPRAAMNRSVSNAVLRSYCFSESDRCS
jgi:hypothetical protein